ncbi:transferase, chloramphenicol acetyltransferase-like domain protein [Tanacetum coccineum]
MQAIRIEVISREHIKPSSPTPQNLRYYKLSMFDQAQMSVYHPFTFFYPNYNDKYNSKYVDKVISDRSAHLKQSLSQTLTRFYPFAGKVASELHIDCNDDGVYYTETRINDWLNNVLKTPDYNFLQRLNPVVDSVSLGSYVSMVQVNFFKCGGVAVSVQHNHKLVDGFSYMMFMKAWAAIARRDQNQVYPKFVSSSMFPQNEKSQSLPIWYMGISPAYIKLGKCATKRFVFNAFALRELKAKASKHSPVSRINAVLALLWKCVTFVTHSKKSVLHLPVNIRPRCLPPMPEYSVGNSILDMSARFDPDTNDLELGSMAVQLKNVIMDVKSASIEELKGKNMHVKFVERLRKSMEIFSTFGNEHIKTTSVCNSGSNEVDFGWGRPVWICTGHMNDDSDIFINRMIMLDSCSGDGIEVWVTLEKHVMDAVMGNPELLSFASVDPSPLCKTGRNKALKTESCGLEDASSLLRRGLNDGSNMTNLQDSIDAKTESWKEESKLKRSKM